MAMTPKQIVDELNKYIIGQDEAKRAVAIALRNRYRRSRLPEEIREEITPKNIIMSGPTGVGKTEIASNQPPNLFYCSASLAKIAVERNEKI